MVEDHGCRAVGEGNGAIRKQHTRKYGVTQMSQTDEDILFP